MLQVLTAEPDQAPRFQEVFMFSHRDRTAIGSFVSVQTKSGAAIQATAGHYIWASACTACSPELVRAGDVQPGYGMWLASPSHTTKATVTVVRHMRGTGLYNPHTASGSIVVNGIAASTFTDVLPPSSRAHWLVTLPGRVAAKLLRFQPVKEAVNQLLLTSWLQSSWLQLAAALSSLA